MHTRLSRSDRLMRRAADVKRWNSDRVKKGRRRSNDRNKQNEVDGKREDSSLIVGERWCS